jgi:hypothetical protein
MTNDEITNDQAPGEFTAYCNRYHKLTRLLAAREERLTTQLDNAPLYSGQTNLSEVDAIIAYYRQTQADKEKVDKTAYDLKETGRFILMIMQHFEIPPGTVLTGEIPGQLGYEISADEHNALHITKTKNLDPLADNPNVIEIKLWEEGVGEEE